MPHLKNKTVENAVAALLAMQSDGDNTAINYDRDTKNIAIQRNFATKRVVS